jgi:hypothetical protein
MRKPVTIGTLVVIGFSLVAVAAADEPKWHQAIDAGQ